LLLSLIVVSMATPSSANPLSGGLGWLDAIEDACEFIMLTELESTERVQLQLHAHQEELDEIEDELDEMERLLDKVDEIERKHEQVQVQMQGKW